MAWYDTGTVSVTNGSTTVTGSGTNFVSGAQIGEAFYGPDDNLYEIEAVVSATELTLADPYLGSTQSGQSYKIVPTQSLVADLAGQVTTLINDFQTVADEAGEGKFDDGSAATPGITFTQDQDTGFFRETANEIGISVGGSKIGEFNSTGLNGTVIGGTTPAAISGTTGQFGTSLNVDGTITSDGLTFNGVGASAIIEANTTSDSVSTTAELLKLRAVIGSSQTEVGNIVIQNRGSSENQSLIRFQTASAGTLVTRMGIDYTGDISFYEDTGATPKFFWDASAESLGIGTSSPDRVLHIADSVPAIKFTDTDVVNQESEFVSIASGAMQYKVDINSVASDPYHSFVIGTSEAMRIDSSGRVGIGTSSPGEALSVGSGSFNSDVARFTGGVSDRGLVVSTFVGDGFSDAGVDFSAVRAMSFSTSASEAMRIDSSGRVGIGSSNPSGKFEVNTGADFAFFTRTAGDDGTLDPALALAVVSTTTRLYSYGDALQFYMSPVGGVAAERMRIDSSGNVGIGKTNPGSAIDVNQDFEYMEGSYVAGSTSADFAVNEPSGSLFLVYLRNTTNGNYNYTALVLFNARATAFGGSQVVVVSSAQGSTGTNGEITSVSITGVNRNTLRVTSSVVGGASNTINVRVRKVELK